MENVINQHHEGSGDNVNNKIVNIISSLRAGHLGTFVEEVLCDINHHMITSATDKLSVIRAIDNVDNSVKALLDVLEIKSRLAQDKPNQTNDNRKLRNIINNSDYPKMLIRLAESVFIELISLDDQSIAREELLRINVSEPIFNEVFFHRLATTEELDNLSTQISHRTDGELFALVKGALRVERFDIALLISDYLNEAIPSPYSFFLKFHVEVILITKKVFAKHVFHYTKDEIKQVDYYADQLLDNFHSNPARFSIPLMNLLSATGMNHQKLLSLAAENIENVKKHNSELAASVISATKEYILPDEIRTLKYREIDLNGFSDMLIAVDNGLLSLEKINEWVARGGCVKSDNEYFTNLSNLLLNLWVVKPDEKNEILKLSKKAEEIIYNGHEHSNKLNPGFILRISERLLYTELPILALKFIEPFIIDAMWISPLYETYLQALYLSEKSSEFFKRVDAINLSDKTEIVLSLEAQACISYHQFDRALERASQLIKLNDKSPGNWYLLLLAHRLNKTELNIIKNIVYQIPHEILSTYNENKRQLIIEIAVNIDIHLSDKILIDWFIQEPVIVSKLLIDIHMQTLDKRSYNNVEQNTIYPSDLCVKGVVFTDDFDSFKKIVVNGYASKHAQFVDASTPLGRVLCSMSVGEHETIPGGNEITLQEELIPYLAVYQLALDIRNKSNDGSDPFRLFTLPEKMDDLVPYLTRMIGKYSTDISKLDHFLLNPELPIFLKGHHAYPTDPAKAIHNLLTYKKVCSLIRLYNDGLINQEEILLDGYTIHFLGQLGLLPVIVKTGWKICISSLTKVTLEQWLSDNLKDNFMSLAVTDKGLMRLTAKDIKSEQFNYIREIRDFLNYCVTVPLMVSDMPDEIVKLRELIDPTVYSTLQLSIANNIPWACLDNYINQILSGMKIDVVNFYAMLNKLSEQCNPAQKARFITAHIIWGLPVSVNYRDLFSLCLSQNELDIYVLGSFLKKYGLNLDSHDAVFNYLFDIISPVMFKAVIDNKILKGGRTHNPAYLGYEEYLFNVACDIVIKIPNGKSAEANLAYFLFLLVSRSGYLPKLNELCRLLASFYASGHFLHFDEINAQFRELAIAHNNAAN